MSRALFTVLVDAALQVDSDTATGVEPGWPVRPFLCFRTDGLALSKSGAGLRLSPTGWQSLALRGAHVQNVAAGGYDELALPPDSARDASPRGERGPASLCLLGAKLQLRSLSPGRR